MTLIICPRCQVRISVANNSGDHVHQCNSGQDVLDQEDVLIKGAWTDYTGSDFTKRTATPNIMWQNTSNKLMGTDEWVRDNTKVVPYTIRGNNAQINRQRQHLEYIEDIKNVPQDTDF